jgi:hypothetical protein
MSFLSSTSSTKKTATTPSDQFLDLFFSMIATNVRLLLRKHSLRMTLIAHDIDR